jgi:hypothetical protein
MSNRYGKGVDTCPRDARNQIPLARGPAVTLPVYPKHSRNPGADTGVVELILSSPV